MVSRLLELHCWVVKLLHEFFDPISIQAILRIPILAKLKPNNLCWIKNPKGAFFVKHAYRISKEYLTVSSNTNAPWQILWKLKGHKRIKMLLWKIGSNPLST